MFPCMMTSRLLGKKNVEGGNDLHLPRALDAIFAFVMKIELVFLKIGVKFPFGGSTLVVVRK